VIKEIQTLPLWGQILGYGLLILGTVFVAGFLIRYRHFTPWPNLTEEGRHLIAMSANIGAFFVVYLALIIWPEFPGRSFIRIGLLVGLVANCGWRWRLLEKANRPPKES